MHVSIAICTHNRADLLQATLERLCRLDQPDHATWDLLVVDNASTDRTPEVLAGFRDKLPLQNVHEPRNGLSHARNCALRHVTGDYILWTDDDVQVDTRWLASFVEGARRFSHATIFGGPVEPWFPSTPDRELMEVFPALRLGFCGVDHERPAGEIGGELNINGANMAFHRQRTAAFQFNPAFGPSATRVIVGDERDFIGRCRAAGASVVWLPDMKVRHYVMPERMQLGYLLRYYHDYATTVVRREGPPSGSKWFGVPRWVIREVIASRLKATVLRPFAPRRNYLLALRSHHYHLGVLRECRAQARNQLAS